MEVDPNPEFPNAPDPLLLVLLFEVVTLEFPPKGLAIELVVGAPKPVAPKAPDAAGLLAPNGPEDAPNGLEAPVEGLIEENGEDEMVADPNAPLEPFVLAPKPVEPNAPPVEPPNGFDDELPNGFDTACVFVLELPKGLDPLPNGFGAVLDAGWPVRLTGSRKDLVIEFGFCVASCKYRTPF